MEDRRVYANKIGGELMQLKKKWDWNAWYKYRHTKEVQVSMLLALIAGIVIGLAISQLI